jgi:hypothetical protein
MEAKKPTKKRKASLDTILSTVQRGFADLEGKMDRGFAAVADDIADIKSTMATKDDVRDIVREELKPIETRLAAVDGNRFVSIGKTLPEKRISFPFRIRSGVNWLSPAERKIVPTSWPRADAR